ncbi:MAG: hypothetical protein ACI865_002966 [Flavobacteriaceae bacterium]
MTTIKSAVKLNRPTITLAPNLNLKMRCPTRNRIQSKKGIVAGNCKKLPTTSPSKSNLNDR